MFKLRSGQLKVLQFHSSSSKFDVILYLLIWVEGVEMDERKETEELTTFGTGDDAGSRSDMNMIDRRGTLFVTDVKAGIRMTVLSLEERKKSRRDAIGQISLSSAYDIKTALNSQRLKIRQNVLPL